MIVEFSAALRPTTTLQRMRLDGSSARGGPEMLQRIGGGELNLQMTDAPGIPGKVLVAVIERWPSGQIEVLWATHANTEAEALALGLPQYQTIRAARRG